MLVAGWSAAVQPALTVCLQVLQHLFCLRGLQPPCSHLLCSCHLGAAAGHLQHSATWSWSTENTISAMAEYLVLTGALAIPFHTSWGSRGILRTPQTSVHATSFLKCVSRTKSGTVLTPYCHFISHGACWLNRFYFFILSFHKYSDFLLLRTRYGYRFYV